MGTGKYMLVGWGKGEEPRVGLAAYPQESRNICIPSHLFIEWRNFEPMIL